MVSHSHTAPASVSRKLIVGSLATLGFVAIEFAIGYLANSLALIGDALHNLTDAIALFIALIVVRIERRPPTLVKSFGYQRAGILAAFLNAATLIGFTIFLFVEAWHRVQFPQNVDTGLMLVLAVVGIILNLSLTFWLRHEGKHDINIRGAVVHLIGDALASVGIVIAAILIRFTGLTIFDPILSVVIGLLILWSSWGILREAVNLLLEGTPRGIDPIAIEGELARFDGVQGVHHLHVWALASSRPALSCHLLLGDISLKEASQLLERVSAMLNAKFLIEHTTIQIEYAGCPEDQPDCAPPAARIDRSAK